MNTEDTALLCEHSFCTDTKMQIAKFSESSSRTKVGMLPGYLCTDYNIRRFCYPSKRAKASGRPISAEQTVPKKRYAKDATVVTFYDDLFENG
jgi:hypothetical protein